MDDTVVLDVRPFHERGEEPLPLYAFMKRRGFTYRCNAEGPDEHHVFFSRP